MSAWVSSRASCDGVRRTAAIGSTTSWRAPSTKRAASTWPCRYFAAISGRNGLMRGSSATIVLRVTRAKQRVERACRLQFGAFRPAGLGGRRPGEDIEMQPGFGAHEFTQEQRRGDGAALATGTYVICIGHLG